MTTAAASERGIDSSLREFAREAPANHDDTALSMAGAAAGAAAAIEALGGTVIERSQEELEALAIERSKRNSRANRASPSLREFAREAPANHEDTALSMAGAAAGAAAAIEALGPCLPFVKPSLRAICDEQLDDEGPLKGLTMCCTCGDGGLTGPLARLGVGFETRAQNASFLLVNYADPAELVTRKMEAAVTAEPPTALVSVESMSVALNSSDVVAAVHALVAAGAALATEVALSCVGQAQLLRRVHHAAVILTLAPPCSFIASPHPFAQVLKH